MIRDADTHSMGAARGRAPLRVGASLALVCLVLLASLAWRAPARAQGTTITLSPDPATINGCETIQVEIWVNDVADLYGLDVQISFDPALLQVVDALPGLTGVQVEPVTTWLDPGWAVRNSADNVAGTIWYAMTMLHPSLPKSGSGPVARIHLQAAGAGSADLHFYYTKLAERSGLQITATAVDGSVETVPLAGPALTISRLNATDARLSWGAVPGVTAYHLYRDTAPYFAPAAPPLYSGTGLVYDDLGALGDVNTNHYYVVRGACDNGFESANSERMGEFDFALVAAPSSSESRHNLIALPLHVQPLITDADSLADYVGSSVKAVYRWDAPTQYWNFRLPHFYGSNFATTTGGAYFLVVDNTAPSVVSFVGGVPIEETITFSLVPGTGANCDRFSLLSVPLDRPDLTTADELADDIGGVGTMYRWDSPTQYWVFRLPHFYGSNFAVQIGYPYYACLTSTAPTTWPTY